MSLGIKQTSNTASALIWIWERETACTASDRPAVQLPKQDSLPAQPQAKAAKSNDRANDLGQYPHYAIRRAPTHRGSIGVPSAGLRR